jgi:predicted dehydrogenase
MFNQRNNPLYRKIKDIVSTGAIGEIRHTSWIITTWWRPTTTRLLGGVPGAAKAAGCLSTRLRTSWTCGCGFANCHNRCTAKLGYGFRRAMTVEDEATAVVDSGQGATGVFITATHDLVGTDRFEILGDSGKIVVDNSATATVTRLKEREAELSDAMDLADISKPLSGRLDLSGFYSTEVIEAESHWGVQHAGMLENFAANILEDTPLIALGRKASIASGWRTPSTCRAGLVARCRSSSTMTSTWQS